MSRSRKRSRVVVIVRGSLGRLFRRRANKAMRRRTKLALVRGRYEHAPRRLEEVSDIYDYKDWSRYVTSEDSESLHRALKKQMRK